MPHRVIPIAPRVCTVPAEQRVLEGPQETVQRILRGLREVVDPLAGQDIVELRWIRSLHIAAGEADLTVTFSPHTRHGRELAGRTFEVLRRLLPDTDVFVHHG